MASPHVFVTLVSSDAYLPGALAQVAALNDLHPHRQFQTLCLVTPESVDVASIKALRSSFDVVVGVEILEDANERGLKLLGRPDLTTVLTKLHVFRLTRYSKIIFLDADVLPLRPLDHLFDLPHEFSAVPDVGWPDIFNSGVLVLSPGEDKFNQLNQLLKSRGSWDGGDQGLLNEWRGRDWHRLSFTYNTTPTAAYTYAPAYERYGSQISALHFIGKNKPWNTLPYRSPFVSNARPSTSNDSPEQAYDYDSLVDRWYAVYDKHYRAEQPVQPSSFAFQRYSSAWDESAAASSSALPLAATGLEALKQMAIDGVASAPHIDAQPTAQGVYYSLPLEGRVDLMRPRKPEPEQRAEGGSSSQEGPWYYNKKSRPAGLDFELLEEQLPATPQFQSSGLYGEDEEGIYRWQTLPTPHPDDVPASPILQPISLPATPTPHCFEPVRPDFYASESESDVGQAPPSTSTNERQPHDTRDRLHGYSRPSSRRPSHGQPNPPLFNRGHPHSQPHREHVHNDSQLKPQESSKRPTSPPLLAWNPALEPPPNDPPGLSSFPSDTYFPNLWDQPQANSVQDRSNGSPSTSINFFQPPPPPSIPSTLIKQGHYRNVTGEDSLSPSPDRTKVKYLFPWEEKPRVLPNRVFPDSDAPPPALFLSPGSPSQTSTAAPSTPEQPKSTPLARIHNLSPLVGLPPSLTYSNAWDSVPSIQKYASKLTRPPQPPPQPLAPAFDDERWRRSRPKSWDDRLEASSRDGDDEDNADDEDEEDDFLGDTRWDSDNDSGRNSHRKPKRRTSESRGEGKREKEYRDQAVQTTISALRAQGTQTEKMIRKGSMSKRHPLPAISPSFLAPPSTRDAVASTAVDRPTVILEPKPERPTLSGRPSKVSLKSGSVSPAISLSPRVRSPMRSPVREFIVPAVPTAVPATGYRTRPSLPDRSADQIKPPPLNTRHTWSPQVSRQPSNDSSITSPASSTGGFPYSNGQPKAGGRVWDPARGVEIFKRGSEEVLARFLRMGNWENEAAR
ncbi:hypothetical protein FA15DRAFT_37011 [Coprinopsis marcescibilis]|uniref:glycogenin glucosyltransferase n=1 Tax=Coprinopsis marcescibilis TaxID=230819 RepID=A0A5C3LG71_COPMA|nr:hypothetical protein FA15DRAFT_37011 [Coprinopsis marcescibilis]